MVNIRYDLIIFCLYAVYFGQSISQYLVDYQWIVEFNKNLKETELHEFENTFNLEEIKYKYDGFNSRTHVFKLRNEAEVLYEKPDDLETHLYAYKFVKSVQRHRINEDCDLENLSEASKCINNFENLDNFDTRSLKEASEHFSSKDLEPEHQQSIDEETEKSITFSYNQFAFDLYRQIKPGKNQNVFVSPFSIVSALSMCYAGARENTEKQLKDLLSFSHLTNDDIHRSNSELFDHLKSLQTGNVQLNIANKLYPKQGYQIRQEFLDTVQKFYSSAVESLDYSNAAQSANTINKWVENETKGKIKDLIDRSAINNLVRLIVVNAIYFKGNWLHKFDIKQTSKEKFHLSDGTTVDVDMMKLYRKNLNCTVAPLGFDLKMCELPYFGQTLAMSIILPNEDANISDIESKLDADLIRSFFKLKASKVTSVFIPKFKFEESIELSNVLKNMGAEDAFVESKANFSGISSDTQKIFISKVIHKATIEVSETGSEAAAATAVIMMTKSVPFNPEPPLEFICNRPFIFILHDKIKGTILFIGKYADP